mmetsp:Transcript_7538/g.19522  ORF Transcript_7538/g.19522 Transcript_7538/m.19522 type:complete len:408 (-) Transcript_7538:14-1237(-)
MSTEEEAALLYRRGMASLSMGSLRKAIDTFTDSIKKKRTAGAFFARGMAKEKSDDHYGAAVDYDDAITASPTYTTAYLRRAKVLRRMGDMKTALEVLQKGAEKEADTQRCRVLFAAFLQVANRYERSIDQCNIMLKNDENLVDAYLIRARAREEDDEWLSAERDVRAALKIRPWDPASILFLGRCHLFRRKDWRQAEETLRLVVPFEMMESIVALDATYGPYRPILDELEAGDSIPKGLQIVDDKGKRVEVPRSVALPALAIYARAHAAHGEYARGVMEVREVMRWCDGEEGPKTKSGMSESWWEETMVPAEEELHTTALSLLLSSNRVDEAVKEGARAVRRKGASSSAFLLYAEALSRKQMYREASTILDEAREREQSMGRVRTWGEAKTAQRLSDLRDRMRGEGF